jgi:hypothetical protein
MLKNRNIQIKFDVPISFLFFFFLNIGRRNCIAERPSLLLMLGVAVVTWGLGFWRFRPKDRPIYMPLKTSKKYRGPIPM